MIKNSDEVREGNFNWTLIDFRSDGMSAAGSLPGIFQMPEVQFRANQLDVVEIDLVLSLDFILEGEGSRVSVGRNGNNDFALLLTPQWKLIQLGP